MFLYFFVLQIFVSSSSLISTKSRLQSRNLLPRPHSHPSPHSANSNAPHPHSPHSPSPSHKQPSRGHRNNKNIHKRFSCSSSTFGWQCGFGDTNLCINEELVFEYSCFGAGCNLASGEYNRNIGFCSNKLNGWYKATWKNTEILLECFSSQNPVNFLSCNQGFQNAPCANITVYDTTPIEGGSLSTGALVGSSGGVIVGVALFSVGIVVLFTSELCNCNSKNNSKN